MVLQDTDLHKTLGMCSNSTLTLSNKSFWDGADKTAMRIDLWTKDMMMDEMADFYYQMMMTMADTFKRATQQQELSDDMKKFAEAFFEKFKAIQLKEQQ